MRPQTAHTTPPVAPLKGGIEWGLKGGTLRALGVAICLTLLFWALMAGGVHAQDFIGDIELFGSIKDRSTGSPGSDKAADYILESFRQAGLSEVGVQEFLTPVPEVTSASLEVNGSTMEIYPWGPNMVYLPMTPEEGIRGRMIYVGNGEFSRFNGKDVKGSIVLMDMSSHGNWLNASMLGAAGVIYLGDQDSARGDFSEKNTPTPLAFPRFWVPPEEGRKLRQIADASAPLVIVKSRTRWQNKMVRNCYALLPGKSPELEDELIVLDAFYDASSHILGMAPGAGESMSVSMLLTLARQFARNPPERSVLFVATTGNGQGLAGTRQFIWTVTTRTKILRREKKRLQENMDIAERRLELLEKPDPLDLADGRDRELIWQLVVERAKDTADAMTREIGYRRALSSDESMIEAEDPRPYRRLSWVGRIADLTSEQRDLAVELLKGATSDLAIQRKELKLRLRAIKSAERLRKLLNQYEPSLFLSLHLSSRSPYVGLAELGDTYPVREDVRRVLRAQRLADAMTRIGDDVARDTGLPSLFKNVWKTGPSQSFGQCHLGTCLCCDIGAMADLPSLSLVTLDDYRSLWSTPHDTLDRLDRRQLETISRFIPDFIGRLVSSHSIRLPSRASLRGFASLEGTARFTRQGELFPDQPAPGTIISVIQGNSVFRTMTYHDGTFFMPGLANKRVSFQKLILEPYGVDPETGRVAWTADKTRTGKVNYRIKVKSDLASTNLVMFRCRQTDVVGAFDPRDMDHLTKVNLLDAVNETTPLRYWYSRIDGRDTMAISVFLEKGTRFKLVLSKSLTSKEFFLLNSSKDAPTGEGFLIGDPPAIPLVPEQVAEDLHLLIGKRLNNLFEHGIMNRYLEDLYRSSGKEIEEARQAFATGRYDRFWSNVVPAWARLNVVYEQVESTERDVLTGVVFFIVLFVPFAYCVERYLFSFRSIYKQIIAFFVILLITVLVIRALHPAFQLTYSPMVVIVAFFIVGLSVLVSGIIFMRFEKEMADLHSTIDGSHDKADHVGKWQALSAGFSIGVSNLNRRKLRTALTCATLIILTFTVMSFTNVKSVHRTTRSQIAPSAPYRGVLIRDPYWMPLSLLTLQDVKARFSGEASVWPRGWIDAGPGRDQTITRVCCFDKSFPAMGILGLGSNAPEYVRKILISGRWFEPEEQRAVLLPAAMARQLRLSPEKDVGASVNIMGDPFRVVGFFDGKLLGSLKGLDGNPLTPAQMEVLQGQELTEVEIEAMQAGEEIVPTSEKFRYADANRTVIFPFEASIQYGGELKAISIVPDSGEDGLNPFDIAESLSSWLSMPLFVGENGVYFHSAGSAIRYQGVANLFVPILIVVFICLNTMIGHVHERQREIGTYTSVGLAPTHVGFLFIVEALSLAVISIVIGYILAQLSAKTLGNTALFSQLTFNYSSLASVASMFLVFAVVLLAALYPARLAAEIAMPDVNRSWTLPEAEGDVIVMNLPFLLKYEEEKGIMGFLHEFYSSHEDATQGAFIVDGARLDVDIPEMHQSGMPLPVCILLRMDVWLAPFDFGIKQHLQLHCCPSPDNPGYLEIAIRMVRLSGERSAWARVSRNFIKALRKEMLVWRLLDRKSKAYYQEIAPVDYKGQMEAAPL